MKKKSSNLTFIQAIKANLPLRRKNRVFTMESMFGVVSHINPKYFIDPHTLLVHCALTKEDVLAKDWIVKRMVK